MNRRAILAGATTTLLAGCSGFLGSEAESREEYLLARITIVNKDGSSDHEVQIVVVADERRVFEGTVTVAPENAPGSIERIDCEFPDDPSEVEVRAILPNGVEGSVNTRDVVSDTLHQEAVMKVKHETDVDANFTGLPTENVPDCENTATEQ